VLAAAIVAASTLAGFDGASASGKPASPVAKRAIVGGATADPANWGFAVAVRHRKSFFCGGSVIAPTVVLTAAHCANAKPRDHLNVLAGRPRLADGAAGEAIPVTARFVHPDYKRKERHDLGLLILATPTTAPPVALASPEDDAAASYPGAPVRVAGYGAKDLWAFNFPRLLKRTTEFVRRPRRCQRIYRKAFKRKSMICSIGRRFKHNHLHSTICSGDSGGPLVTDTAEGPRQIGVTSFGGPICGWGLTPAVYARVSDGLRFIERITGISPAVD
jgi:trypsin